jgi:AcrR family transcriptional regulator
MRTIADIAADAGVSRPTTYRRWSDKLQLVSDALDHGLKARVRTPDDGDLVDTMAACGHAAPRLQFCSESGSTSSG